MTDGKIEDPFRRGGRRMEEMKKSPTLDELFTSLECVVGWNWNKARQHWKNLSDFMRKERYVVKTVLGNDLIRS